MFLKSIFRHPAHYSLVAGFLAFTSLFFLSCFETKTSPLDPNTVSELQYKGSISGHVRDEATTKGISGVSVVCAPGGFSTSTDTTGHYIIPDVSGGTYSVTFSGNKYNDSILNGITIAIDQDLPELDVFLKKFLCKFGGTITDNRTAAKLAGTTITAVSTDNVSFTTTTDTAGNYVLNLIIGTYTVTFMRDGYLPVTVAGIDVKKGQYSYPFSQQLKSAICQISGNVLDKRTLSGIAGVQVSIDSTTITATTNVDGYYIINVPNDSARSLSVNFTHAIYRDTTVKGISVAKEQALRSLNIMLVEEIGSISGKVTDQQTLAGITGVAVTCNISGITTTTDQAGNYTLTNLLPGMYKLTFTNTQYRTTRMDSVFISSGEQKTGINIALGKLSSSIAGRVIDIQGNSISGVAVTIGSLGFSTTTSTDGTYVLPNVPQGTYTLFFTNADYRDTSVANVNLTSGQFLTGVDVSMRILLSSIAGKVTDKTTGGGISGVAVTSSKVGISTTTDQSGNYVLSNLSKGSYRLTFTNAQYHDTTLADSVKVVAGENKAGVNVAMDKLQSSVSGSIIDQESAAGISGVTVTASPGGYSSSTNSSGTFTIPNVPQGTYALSFTNSNYKDTILLGVTLSAGEYKTGINITMLKLRATISGVVTNLAKGTAETGVAVSITGVTATTNASGAYTLSNVPAGTYTIQFTKSGFTDTTTQNVNVTPGQVLTGKNMAIRQNNGRKNISGLLTGNIINVSRVIATVAGDSIPVAAPLIDTLDWTFATGIFSGQIQIPVVGSSWNVTVRIFDQTGMMIGYRKVPFTSASGAIGVASFNAENAKPAASAGADTTVSIKDAIWLHGTATDSFNLAGAIGSSGAKTNIIKWEWSINGGAFLAVTNGDTNVFAPSAVTPSWKGILKVTDSDGNIGLDTMNTAILLDAPLVDAGPDTIIDYGTTVNLHGVANDAFGSIAKYEWDYDGAGTAYSYVQTNTGTSIAILSLTEASAYLRVTDDDGNISVDSVHIKIRPQAVSLTVDSIFGKSAYLHWDKALDSDFLKYRITISKSTDPNIPILDTLLTNINITSLSTSFLSYNTQYIFNAIIIDKTLLTSSQQNISKSTSLAWSSKTPCPVEKDLAFTCVLNNKIYSIGGGIYTTLTNSVYVYDPENDTWASAAPIPQTAFGITGVVSNGLIYVFGLDSVYSYSHSQNKWQSVTISAYSNLVGSSSLYGSKAFLTGGSGVANSALISFNFTNNQWSSLANLPEKREGHYSCILNDTLFIFGGAGVGNYYNSVRKYGISGNDWLNGQNMLNSHYYAAGAVLNNRVFIFSGVNSNGASEEYDYTANLWNSIPPMPEAIARASAAVYKNKIYIVGGQGKKTVYCFEPR